MQKAEREYLLRQQLRPSGRNWARRPTRAPRSRALRGEDRAGQDAAGGGKEAVRELGRMEKLSASSPEYSVIRTSLEWMTGLLLEQDNGLSHRHHEGPGHLDEDHYDLDKVKDRILEYLSVKKLGEDRGAREGTKIREPISLLRRPSGRGKDSLGQSIARALDRKFIRLSLGGLHDEAEIRGHRRTYIGAMPGRIIQTIKRVEAKDPVIMLDEVDKIGADWRGDPSRPLLEVLDPGTEQGLPRQLPGRCLRPLKGHVHYHGEPARDHTAAAPGPHGTAPAPGLYGVRETEHRQKVSHSERDRGERAQTRGARPFRTMPSRRHQGLHP